MAIAEVRRVRHGRPVENIYHPHDVAGWSSSTTFHFSDPVGFYTGRWWEKREVIGRSS